MIGGYFDGSDRRVIVRGSSEDQDQLDDVSIDKLDSRVTQTVMTRVTHPCEWRVTLGDLRELLRLADAAGMDESSKLDSTVFNRGKSRVLILADSREEDVTSEMLDRSSRRTESAGFTGSAAIPARSHDEIADQLLAHGRGPSPDVDTS